MSSGLRSLDNFVCRIFYKKKKTELNEDVLSELNKTRVLDNMILKASAIDASFKKEEFINKFQDASDSGLIRASFDRLYALKYIEEFETGNYRQTTEGSEVIQAMFSAQTFAGYAREYLQKIGELEK